MRETMTGDEIKDQHLRTPHPHNGENFRKFGAVAGRSLPCFANLFTHHSGYLGGTFNKKLFSRTSTVTGTVLVKLCLGVQNWL
jgi:hypothetical protein